MPTHVCLLRGINVGGNKKVEMKTLKTTFEDMGYTHVSTYINSGNVLFAGTKPDAARIEAVLQERFGFPIPVVLRSAQNITELCRQLPSEWQNDDEQKTDILFLWEQYDSVDSLGKIATRPRVDTLRYFPGAIAWNLRKEHYAKSGMHTFIGSEIYKHMTARNINTVRKLAALLTA